jgi:hypothetical protein
LIVVDGEAAIPDLREGFDVDVGPTIYMDDCGLSRLPVDEENLSLRRGLCRHEKGQGKNNRQRRPNVECVSSHREFS